MKLSRSLNAEVTFEDEGLVSITPQDLVSTVSVLTEVPLSRVRNFDRKLMEAGLRTKKGHGRGSAIMTPADAAILLIAIATSDEISSAPKCALQASKLPAADGVETFCKITGGQPREFRFFGDTMKAVLQHLPDRQEHTFILDIMSIGGSPVMASIGIVGAKGVERIAFCHENVGPKLLRGMHVSRSISNAALEYLADCLAGKQPVLKPKATA
jgi:hypothetical protein